MSIVDPVWAGVAELSRAFEARALSPVDVVDALLARIKAREAFHAYIAIYEYEARLAAEAADRAISISRAQLAATRVLAAAGGRAKRDAVRGALRTGLLSALVTDAATARHALEEVA